MRNAFLDTLISCASDDARLCLIVGDLGYSVVEPFRDRFGPRFINAGIAEQNMTGVAAGMAMTGLKVFTYSIANFPTLRCFEQIRNDVCYHRANVVVVAVGGGLGYGPLGYSHHAVQDIACMRTLPGMLMATPGDPNEVLAVTRYLAGRDGPAYLRLGKGGEPRIDFAAPTIAGPRPILVLKGGSKAILACGTSLILASQVAKETGATLYSCPLWDDSLTCRNEIASLVSKHQLTVTVEEHLAAGGFGSFVRECLDNATDLLAKVRCLALGLDTCEGVGSQARLRQRGGLTTTSLIKLLNE